nr:MAG TPA_asm: hypothetical protein [Caudoviricetes sp.]
MMDLLILHHVHPFPPRYISPDKFHTFSDSSNWQGIARNPCSASILPVCRLLGTVLLLQVP